MSGNGAAPHAPTRIHAIILTRDRTDVFSRCVDTAISTMKPDDTLTVLDDSCATIARVNAEVLAKAACRSTAHVMYLQAERVHNAMARVTGGSRALWQAKTAPRDIAPLRNLSLLISAAVDAHTTVLVDDDICGFDVDATHRLLDEFDCPEGAVVGTRIGGMTEQDTVTRLSDAMRLLEAKAQRIAVPVEELFRVPPDGDDHAVDGCEWVSAGYMAFRFPAARLLAFPPGYNEDWLWCLLHGARGDTGLLRVDQAVEHEPPSLRRSTRADVLFELVGDLILDCLAECRDGRPRGPETVLEDLAQHAPDPSVMPLVRVDEVLEQARQLSEDGFGPALFELEGYGLSVLGEMRRSGELDMDGNTVLRNWSGDAVAKQRSFTATLRSTTARAALQAALQEGRL